jgi:hypothetical protein
LKTAKKGKLKNGYVKSLGLESDDQRNIIPSQIIKIERLETTYDEQKEAATKVRSEIRVLKTHLHKRILPLKTLKCSSVILQQPFPMKPMLLKSSSAPTKRDSRQGSRSYGSHLQQIEADHRLEAIE